MAHGTNGGSCYNRFMHTAYARVTHLDCHVDELQFQDFRIWRVAPPHLQNAQRVLPGGNIHYEDWVYERKYVTVPGPKGPSRFGRIPFDTEDTLFLFRLFKAGDITFTEHTVEDSSGGISRQYPVRTQADISTTRFYKLEQAECPLWDRFRTELTSSEAWGSEWFTVARRFFLYGGAKEFNLKWHEVDRIVDYIVALEATLVPERDFVGRRLRNRAARLLEWADPERRENEQLLKNFYDIRSAIVHGSRLSDKVLRELKTSMGDFEDAVRQILVAALRSLPNDESFRRQKLVEMWDVSDGERGERIIELFNGISGERERKRISRSLTTSGSVAMVGDDAKWRLVDLHYANYQSISKAQKVHLSTLMGFLSLVWGWHIIVGGGDVTVQMLGVTLKANGFWAVTPAVVALFSLGLIGSMNAAGPAREKLEAALHRVGVETGVDKEFVMYELDTHKNIFDYFTFLRLHPERKHFEGRWNRFEARHFLYPGLLGWGIYTTYYAAQELTLSESTPFTAYATVCLVLQIIFWVRPLWRAVCRFLGIRKDIVYY